jgi:ATP-dependent Clp endopeptidase proteolytic subunit ClpP
MMKKRIALVANEVRDSDAHARQTEIETHELERRYSEFQAGDHFNRVFRFTESVNEKSVSECMDTISRWARLSKEPIEIIFFSPGGEIIQGMALFDFLQGIRALGIRLITGATGMAASMAGILLQAGDHRWCGEQSWILIHRPSGAAMGSLFEIEDSLEWSKRLEERCMNILTARSHLTKKDIATHWERKDWWLTSEEALEAGLVDEISNKQPL